MIDSGARMHPSGVLIPCPVCRYPMSMMGAQAQCDNYDCDEQGVQYRVEMPLLGVKIERIAET